MLLKKEIAILISISYVQSMMHLAQCFMTRLLTSLIDVNLICTLLTNVLASVDDSIYVMIIEE